MGDLGLVFALVFGGYILGVWTGALVFRQRQRGYEDAEQAAISSPSVTIIRHPSHPAGRR